jgi:hypothetical protein
MGERTRQPRGYSDAEKARYATEQRARGATWPAIGKVVGMSPNGVKALVERTTNPARYYGEGEEEERPLPPPGEEW